MPWSRYKRGRPLFIVHLTERERDRLERGLKLRARGVGGVWELLLTAEVVRDFALFASDFFARRATRLQWNELLAAGTGSVTMCENWTRIPDRRRQ
jgi:hypothetical protein